MSVLNLTFEFSGDDISKMSNVPVSEQYMFYVTGSFGGGTVSLEASPDKGVNWFTVEQLAVPGRLIRYLVSGEMVRVIVENSNDPNLTAGIRQ
jgi:hypothetical protein